MKKLIVGASIGNCVHIAGILHFLDLAKNEGYETKFLGPATDIVDLCQVIEKMRPDIVSISYRLTPENAYILLNELYVMSNKLVHKPEWTFGGTRPVADIAEKFGWFRFISDGYDEISDSIRYLRGINADGDDNKYDRSLVGRIQSTYPFPILRHHYGRPTLRETISGIEKIAKSKVLDVISLGPDQNAQEFFFRQENMKKEFDGAGGTPIRSKIDFKRLKDASKFGNCPLMRSYSGTADVFQYAELLVDSIDNAWAAIPLCWYNELDGRGKRTLEESIRDAQNLIKWHAVKDIPVEVNEPHHWGLRDAHDVIPVVMAYISAYNAKKFGAKHYIAQYMFNNPSTLSFSMDLSKILAMVELVDTLADDNFKIFKETRAGLSLFHADQMIAKGQLAASTFMQMAIKPHIMHVVGFSEANHASTADEVIESCKIVKGVIRHVMDNNIDIINSCKIQNRKNELISEARVLIDFINMEYKHSEDPLVDPIVLCDCVEKGYIDAVHILKNDKYRGELATSIIDGKCCAIDLKTKKVISESVRLKMLKDKYLKNNINE